ncbi:MAG: hypothetical protein AB7N54_08545 [Alphaproteobacteria bacterium]
MGAVRLPLFAVALFGLLLAGCIPLPQVADEPPRATEVFDVAWEPVATCLRRRLKEGYGEEYEIDWVLTRPERLVVITARNRTLDGGVAAGTSWLVTVTGRDDGKTQVEARTRWMPVIDTLPATYDAILARCTKPAAPPDT